ncbi:hypothetical protein JCM3774_003155 [Rhodotorula dairenensis]
MADRWGYGPNTSRTLPQLAYGPGPHAAAASLPDSQLLPAPPPAAMLPPPPPARDLHGARARITLEKVKLEIEAVREVLAEVDGLREAVKGLQTQVDLLRAERDATDQAVEDRVARAVKSACDEYARKLKASLEQVAHQVLASVASSESRAKQSDDAVLALETSLRQEFRAQVVQIEAEIEKRFVRLEKSERHPVELRKHTQDFDSLDTASKGQAAPVRRVEAKTSDLAQQLPDRQAAGRHLGTVGTQVAPTPSLPSRVPTIPTAQVKPAAATGNKSTTASSPSLPPPSPPRRKVPLRPLVNQIVAAGGKATSPLTANPTEKGYTLAFPYAVAHVGFGPLATRASADQQTPMGRRRLLVPEDLTGRASSGSDWTEIGMIVPRTTTTRRLCSGPEEGAMEDENRRARAAKCRRTIKQDESLGSSSSSTAQQDVLRARDVGAASIAASSSRGMHASKGEPRPGTDCREEHESSSEEEPDTEE